VADDRNGSTQPGSESDLIIGYSHQMICHTPRVESRLMFGVALFLACACVPLALLAAPNDSVADLIAKIRGEQDVNARYMLSFTLPDLVERQRDTSNIDAIASLLEDPSDAVRGFAASALARIGPAAARVTPMLATALLRAEREFIRPGELRPSAFSGDQICEALQSIGSAPTGVHCRNGFYGQ